MSSAGTHILIQVVPRANDAELAARLEQIPGVVRVTQVDGPYDAVAELDGSATGLDPSVTTSAIRKLEGVLHAIPLVATSVPMTGE